MELVKSVSVDNLIQQRAAVIERITTAHRLLQEAAQIMTSVLGDGHRHNHMTTLECRFNRTKCFTDNDDLPYFVQQQDASLWQMLMNESGLRTFMDAAARTKWDNDIVSCNVPPFTRENINATFANLYADRQAMFERGVVAVFRNLSWDYKTNNPVKFGRRIVDRHVVWSIGGEVMGVNSDGAARVDDLLRVMLVLDGKPEPDHRAGTYHALSAANWPKSTKDVTLHGMVSIRGFKNGNAHITFLRPDLVDAMNRIVAKHHPLALPPASD